MNIASLDRYPGDCKFVSKLARKKSDVRKFTRQITRKDFDLLRKNACALKNSSIISSLGRQCLPQISGCRNRETAANSFVTADLCDSLRRDVTSEVEKCAAIRPNEGGNERKKSPEVQGTTTTTTLVGRV